MAESTLFIMYLSGGVLIITFVVLYSLGTFRTINPKVKKTLWVVLTVVNYTFSACLVIQSVLEFLVGDFQSGFISLGIAIGIICYQLRRIIWPDHVKRQKNIDRYLASGKVDVFTGERTPVYQVSRKGQVIGHYDREEIVDLFYTGELLPSDCAWTEGMEKWESLQEMLK